MSKELSTKDLLPLFNSVWSDITQENSNKFISERVKIIMIIFYELLISLIKY